jgi:hypothetical protein
VPDIVIECKHCSAQFGVCRRCYRGQKFCSDDCRRVSSRLSRRAWSRNYDASSKGKETRSRYRKNPAARELHKKRQRSYRIRRHRRLLSARAESQFNSSCKTFRDADHSLNSRLLVPLPRQLNKVASRNLTCLVCRLIIGSSEQNDLI